MSQLRVRLDLFLSFILEAEKYKLLLDQIFGNFVDSFLNFF